jgi:hypothetical protein
MPIIHQFNTDSDTLFSLLTDPDVLVARSAALGEKNISCEAETLGRKTVVRLERTVKRDLPKVLAAMFDAENTIRTEEQWETVGNSHLGNISTEVVGQPVTLSAKFKIKPTETGCEYSIDYQCKANIPIVGKKVEEFIISQTASGLDQEMRWLKDKLE